MSDRTFDRIPSYDDRSMAFGVRALLDAPARSYTWRHVQLDQGSEGACTGFAATMEAAARPVPVFGDPVKAPPPDISLLNWSARSIYLRAKEIDEWPGEDYEGSSVLAAMKAGAEWGWWSEYRWALGPGPEAAADDVCRTLGRLGPVVLGTYWWDGMWAADGEGYLHPSGQRVGGHAYLLTAYNRPRDAVWTPNSWGGAGQGWIRRADLTELLADSGEATVPVRRLRPAVP